MLRYRVAIRLRSLLRAPLVLAGCLSAGCVSPADTRMSIENIDISWIDELPDGSLAEMTVHIRDLGRLKPGSSEALLSLPLLTRQAYQNESAWVRTESLRAAWSLAREIPVTPLLLSREPAVEFNGWMHGFEELDDDPKLNQGEQIQQLALLIGSYCFPPEQARYAIELAAVTTARGLQRNDSPVQAVFARLAPESCRHALCLVTLLSGDDKVAYVREEALHAARYLDLETAVSRLVATLTTETDQAVLLALLGSVDYLAQKYGIEPVAEILEYASHSGDAAVRRRAESILEGFEA